MSQNESLPVTHNSEGPSPLAQRLQRRLLTAGGVINTRQLHRHYQSTQRTAGKLNQRLGLPERVQLRYQTSVFQPGEILQRLQRPRKEWPQFPQLQGQPRLNQSPVASYQSDSPWSKGSEIEQISRFRAEVKGEGAELLPQPPQSPTLSINQPLTPLRISRQATIAAASPQFRFPSSATQSSLLQLQTKPRSPSESASSPQPDNSNPTASVSTRSPSSGQLRVSRPETMAAVPAQFTPITVREAPSSVQRKPELSSELAQELTLVQTPSLPQPGKNPLPTQASTPAESGTSVSLIQPQAQFTPITVREAPSSVQRKPKLSSESTQKLTVVQTPSFPQLEKNPLPTQAGGGGSLPMVKVQQVGSGLIQTQRMPAISGMLKPSSSQGMPSNIVWRKSKGESLASESVASSSQEMVRRSLPLAINKTNGNGRIARQMDTLANSMVELPAQGTSTIPGSMTEMGAISPPDINLQQLAERVSRILARQLIVERERRGIGRWH